MMRMLFAMMDSDGDGTVSLQEFQAAHERIFKAMDANKDGRLTVDEVQAFMRGTGRAARLGRRQLRPCRPRLHRRRQSLGLFRPPPDLGRDHEHVRPGADLGRELEGVH